jgi:hypothetical protein
VAVRCQFLKLSWNLEEGEGIQRRRRRNLKEEEEEEFKEGGGRGI